MTRLATGIEGFDAMVQGGLPAGSSVVLQGPPGQEKLRFALTFLAEGLKSGASGLVLISTQSPDAALAELRALGVNIDAVTAENRLRIVDWYSWSEETVVDIEDRGLVIRSSIDLTNVGVALSRAIASLSGDQPRRAVIELLSPAMNAYELTQVYAFAQSTKKKFDRHGFTSLVLLEKDMHSGPEITTLLQPFDGVIELERIRSGDRILRKIGVLHLKDTAADPTFRLLEMTESGMRVVRETTKPSAAAPSVTPAAGAVLESQEERARRLSLIMQIASERLKLNPKDADALFAMAAAQATLDDPRAALQSLERLADLDPAYPGLWVLKTKLHARLGEADRARQSRLRADQVERPEARQSVSTVPCPMCDSPVAEDATSCGNCGVKFATAPKLEDELDDLGRAAIQDMVQEELHEGVPRESAKPKPLEREARTPDSSKPERVPPPTPSPKPTPKKGLTNGLVLSRNARRRAGMTNGLRGRTNGLRGRTNGLTNGLGRTNGLTNGVGRTNGLTNGLGHTNGLTNGLGRTNGLTNGLGRTNGITNGLGRTNGLTNGLAGARATGFRSAGLRGMMQTAGWKLYVIPLVVVGLLLMPLFFVPEYHGPSSPIQIDGQFNDWVGVTTEAMASGGVLNPNVDVIRFGVVPNLGPMAFYVEVAGSALMGGGPAPGTMDTVRIFIDIDGSSSTGYRIDGLGADRMIDISGYRGKILSSTLWEFDSNRNQRDWNGWIKGTATPAAASGSRIEAEAQWLADVPTSVPIVAAVHTVSWDKQVDSGDFPVSPGLGTLSIVSDPQVPDVIAGNDVPLFRLTLTAHGQPVSLNSLQVEIAGTAPGNVATSLRLTDGTNLLAQAAPVSPNVRFSFAPVQIAVSAPTTLFVVGDFASTTGETFGVQLPSIHPFGVGGGVVALRENPGPRTLGYLGIVPAAPRVDGGFDEWKALSVDPMNDVAPRANPNIDLTHYGGLHNGTSTFLYADVSGRILAGTPTPENPRQAPRENSTSLADTDRDSVPDVVDPMPYDFNNDGIPDAKTNCDVDGDGIIDYGCPGGTDYWLNTTIPSNFPAPYGGRFVSLYIGPDNRPAALGEDVVRIFLDVDNSTFSGYSIGGIGADRLLEIRGKDGTVTQSALLAFSGSFPAQWAWTPLSPVTVALGYHAVELSVSLNATKMYVEAGDFWGSVDSTTVVPAFAPLISSFKASSANAPLTVPWQQAGPQLTSTLIDPGSNAITTDYNHQRKVVRAGTGAGVTPCDAANSAGCWYVTYQDEVPTTDSASKDGASVAVPTSLGLLDSLTTTLAAGNDLVIAFIQFNNTGASARLITAGNVQIRRGTQTSDPLLAQTQFEMRLSATGAVGDGNFAALIYRDAGATASPTYGVFAAVDAAGVNAEVKVLAINGLASSDSAFTDGGSVSVVSSMSLGSVSTSFPASSASLPNLVVAAVQTDALTGRYQGPSPWTAIRRGTLSSDTVISSNQLTTFSGSNVAPDGIYQILVALDTAGGANQAYSVWTLDNSGNTPPANGEAKILAFRGLSASWVDTGSVSVGSTRQVIGTATTTFPAGDDVAIGAIELVAVTSTRQIAAGGDDVRRVGEAGGTNNQFMQVLATNLLSGCGMYQGFLRKVSTSASNPSYEGAVTGPAASSLNAELKLLVVHIRDTKGGWDRVFLNRSLDTSGSTWGAPILLASGLSSDTPLLYGYDSAEPSLAIDASGYLHLVWVSAAATGDQSTLNLVRYTKTLVPYPTQAQLAIVANWAAVTAVDDTAPGYMPTISTDSSNNPHIAWSGSKTSGTVYFKGKAGGSWRSTVSWGTTYTGLSVDVSPQNNYVTLAGYFNNTAELAAIAYRSNTGTNTVNSAKTRTWDGTVWSAESEQGTAGSPIRVVRMAWSPADANTRIMVTESDDGFLDAYVCTQTCVVTNNIGQVWSTAPASGTPQARFDIAYEQVSGKAMLTYHKEGGSGTQDLAYKTYSGGSWSAEQYIDDPGSASTHYVYTVVKLASKRGSNQIGLIGGDFTNTHVNAWIWDGTTWGNFVAIATTNVGPVDRDNADLAWESSSGNLLAVAASNTANIVSKEYSTSWGSAVTFACASGATIRYTRLKANPLATANDMVLAVVDDPSYNLNTCYWTGSGWANSQAHGAINQVNYRAFDFAWEASGSKGLLVGSTNPTNLIAYRSFTAPNMWGTINTVAVGSSDHTWIQARTNPVSGSTTKILGAASDNTAQTLGGFKWDGTTFTVISTNTFTANTGGFMSNEMFDLKYPEVRAGGTGEIREMVCRNLAASNCTASSDFTKWDGTAGIDTVAIGVPSSTYPSLATTWDSNADLWVAYEKDINATSRGMYARFLDYPTAGWQAPETVDSLAGTVFIRPSIGVDKDNNVHALYVSTSGPQLYYKMRSAGVWGSRTAIDTTSDSPSLMVRAPNDATYGTSSGALYWKSSTSETYFYYIPEFENVILPILGVLILALSLGKCRRTKKAKVTSSSPPR